MRKFKISEAEYLAIKEREKATTNKRIACRLRVLMLRYEGKTDGEIAEAFGLHKASVSAMCMRYMEQGLEEYARNKYTSHNRLLSEEKEKEILSRFTAEAEAGHFITTKEIKAALDKELGRESGKMYVYDVLKRHQWSKVTPRPKHPKSADKEACEASKKLRTVLWRPQPKPEQAACG